MAMGLGHNYWVEIIKGFKGSLQNCIKWMEENNPKNNHYWYELHPCIQWNKKERIKVDEYRVDLVTDGDLKKRNK